MVFTGAGRGLDLAIAQAALESREQVAATGRDPEAVASANGSDDDRLTRLTLDVRDRAQTSEAVTRAEAATDPIDVLVNNAGYSQTGIFDDIPPQAIEDEHATNVCRTMNVLRVCAAPAAGGCSTSCR